MKCYLYLSFLGLFLFGGCLQTNLGEDIEDLIIQDTPIAQLSLTKDAIRVTEIVAKSSDPLADYLLHPLDNFSNSDPKNKDTLGDFLFIDPKTKTIGIRFWDFVSHDYNAGWEERLNEQGFFYEEMFPAFLRIPCINRSFEVLPTEYSANARLCLDNEFVDEKDFYYHPIIEADFDSFEIRTGRRYGADKNHVYAFLRNDIPFNETGFHNYEILREKGLIRYPFYKIVEGANPLSGNQSEDPEFLIQNFSVLHTGKMYWSEPYKPTF